jgi:hypothetical protein
VAPWKSLVESPDNFLETIKEMRESPSVESPYNFLETIKGMRESPSMDSSSKLCKVE